MVNKKLIIKKRRGFIQSVENPNVKKGKTVYLVQRLNFTGWTPTDAKGNRIRGVARGRNEANAIHNVLIKGHRKVIIRD